MFSIFLASSAHPAYAGSYCFDIAIESPPTALRGQHLQTLTMPITPELYHAQIADEDIQVDAWADAPLLQSLEEGGVDWPSSCRNGTCRTCVGRLTSGSVHYEIEWPGLSPEDKEAGCILPCVAYPDGNVVLLRGEY